MAAENKIIASAIVFDAKITGNDGIEDAIIVSLEHIDNYSVNVAFPYKKIKKLLKSKIEFYEPFNINVDREKGIF